MVNDNTSQSSAFVISTTKTHIYSSARAWAEAFRYQRAVYLGQVLAPDFLMRLMQLCKQARFVDDPVRGVGHRETEQSGLISKALSLALRRSECLTWVAELVGAHSLNTAEGCIARTCANGRDALDWHDDLNDPRRHLAITINLSPDAYEGGQFELRNKHTKTTLFEHRHSEPGSAVLFDVSHELEHRVLPLTSGGPRCVFAGWFLETSS